MVIIMDTLIERLNHENADERLAACQALADKIEHGEIARPGVGCDVNNHIHTTYSFSPYSPAKAVWMAYMAGLSTAGLMDHDSIGGAEEFIAAGRILGMATTIGVECRADVSGTALDGKKINNPDQASVAYVALHGIPHTQIARVREFFAPYMEKRDARNRKMVDKINALFAPLNVALDYDSDVIPLSMRVQGGSVTERHLLFALCKKLTAQFSKGEAIVRFLKEQLNIVPSEKAAAQLTDTENPHYDYDLLGMLKGELVSAFYVPATDECPRLAEVAAFADEIGAIPAYAYLGDVTDSVTGDKRAQKFEDGYLDLLFDVITKAGFHAVTYMPSRNTVAQLARVMALCGEYGLLQISGEDINSPRQSFVCMAQRDTCFRHLEDAAWALIGHELAATKNLSDAFFSKQTVTKYPVLNERIAAYKSMAKR